MEERGRCAAPATAAAARRTGPRHGKAEGHVHVLQVLGLRCAEVESVGSKLLSQETAGLKVAHDGLCEVVLARVVSQGTQVHVKEVFVLPERRLGHLFVPKRVVGEGAGVDRARGGHHEAAGPQEALAGHHIGLKHALVDQEEAHGLRYDHVHLLGQLDLLHLTCKRAARAGTQQWVSARAAAAGGRRARGACGRVRGGAHPR